MKKLKLIIIAIVLTLVLHVVIVFALSDAKIFSCQTKPTVYDMEKLEWKDGKCDVGYKYRIGSVQKLTTNATVARIGLIYVLPLLITAGIMYGLRIRNRQSSTALIQE